MKPREYDMMIPNKPTAGFDLRFRCPNSHILREACSLKAHVLLDRCMRNRKIIETGWVVDNKTVHVEYCSNEGWMKANIKSETDISTVMTAAVALALAVGLDVNSYTVFRNPTTFHYELHFYIRYVQIKNIDDAVAIMRRIVPTMCVHSYEQRSVTVNTLEYTVITNEGVSCRIHAEDRGTGDSLLLKIVGMATDQCALKALYVDILSHPLVIPDVLTAPAPAPAPCCMAAPTPPSIVKAEIESQIKSLYKLVLDLEARIKTM